MWESPTSSGLVDVWLGLLLSIRDCPLGNPLPPWLTRENTGTLQSRVLGNAQGFSTGPCGLLECSFCFPKLQRKLQPKFFEVLWRSPG